LRFSGLSSWSIEGSAQLEILLRGSAFRRAQVVLGFQNIFDRKVVVRDSNGITPFSYRKPFLDPVGREVGLTLRKLF